MVYVHVRVHAARKQMYCISTYIYKHINQKCGYVYVLRMGTHTQQAPASKKGPRVSPSQFLLLLALVHILKLCLCLYKYLIVYSYLFTYLFWLE